MPKVYKLSIEGLKRIISEERRALNEEGLGPIKDIPKKPNREVDADEFADTLEKDIDHLKAMKVSEAKLLKKLKQLREAKQRQVRKIKRSQKKGA